MLCFLRIHHHRWHASPLPIPFIFNFLSFYLLGYFLLFNFFFICLIDKMIMWLFYFFFNIVITHVVCHTLTVSKLDKMINIAKGQKLRCQNLSIFFVGVKIAILRKIEGQKFTWALKERKNECDVWVLKNQQFYQELLCS